MVSKSVNSNKMFFRSPPNISWIGSAQLFAGNGPEKLDRLRNRRETRFNYRFISLTIRAQNHKHSSNTNPTETSNLFSV